MKTPLPAVEYLRECFRYNQRTGILTWRRRPRGHFASDGSCRRWHKLYAGHPAGWHGPGGYMVVEINATPYRVHRIIWKLRIGIDPNEEIDHRNRDKADNRWRNLREATPQQNTFNQTDRTKASGLPKGVYLNRGRYVSYVRVDRRSVFLGSYDTPDEARTAYVAFTRPERGEFYTE